MAIVFKTLVAPTDFSPFAEAALQYARVLAEQFGAEVHLVHALERPQDMPWWMAEQEYRSRQGDLAEKARSQLAALTARLFAGIDAQAHVRVGIPSDEIVTAARDLHADLIVIGTHGRSGLSRVLFGSVTERVMRHAPCPVLTVRPQPRPHPEEAPR